MSTEPAQQLEAARREMAELYQRLGQLYPLSPERIRIHMRISRLRKQIPELERAR